MHILYDQENRTAFCILGSRLSMPNATILNFGKIAFGHFSWRHKKTAQKKKKKTEAICHSFALLKNSQKMLEIE